jgi:hypothetical protein
MFSSHTDPESLSARLRARRMSCLDDALAACGGSGLVLADLGGTRSFWKMNLSQLRCRERISRIDVFNLDTIEDTGQPIEGIPVFVCQADVTALAGVSDKKYDVAFSNSVIEHVGNLAMQKRFADETRRIARRFVLQTPARSFPLEPHFYVPFFAQWPLSLRAAMHRRLKLGWLAPEPDPLQARIDCDNIRLLSRHELKLLFSGSTIRSEWMAGLVKSYIICG